MVGISPLRYRRGLPASAKRAVCVNSPDCGVCCDACIDVASCADPVSHNPGWPATFLLLFPCSCFILSSLEKTTGIVKQALPLHRQGPAFGYYSLDGSIDIVSISSPSLSFRLLRFVTLT